MQYTIRSDQLEVTVNALGAEMVSIRGADGTDYLCPESRRNWYASAPVLFPNTGAVKDQYALVEGKRYPFRQHGFARESMFSPVGCGESEMAFELRWSEETLQIYPYRFVLRVSYRVEGDTLTVKGAVRNEDSRKLYASLGFHPGFSCPFSEAESPEDYEIVFPQRMTASRIILKDALAAGKAEKFWDDLPSLPVKNGMFDGGSFSMTDLSSHCVRLVSKVSGRSVTLYFDDYPNLILWAPVGLPITNICMEPWYGMPDPADHDHRLETHPLTFQVEPGGEKELAFRIVCK